MKRKGLPRFEAGRASGFGCRKVWQVVARITSVLALLIAALGGQHLVATNAAADGAVSLIVPATSNVWASSSYPGAPPQAAFDCDQYSPWNAGNWGGTLWAQFTQPITFNGIQLTVDATPGTPETYTFSGSNDGVTWTTITSDSPYVPGGAPTLPLVTFPTVSYSYLEIDVNGGASWVAITNVVLQVTAGNPAAVGTCGTAPPSLLSLSSTTPDGGTVAAGPAPSYQGVASFSATLATATPAGVLVTFTVTGANPQTLTATTDVNGIATVRYSGTNPGTDTAVAHATVNGETQTSGLWSVSWGVPAPTITDLVAGGYVPGGSLRLTGTTVPHGHILCRHRNGADIWETDADDAGFWSVDIKLGSSDGNDILYVQDGSGGGYFNLYAGGAGGFNVIVDGSGSGPDFHVAGGDGGGVNNVYLGDADVGIYATNGSGTSSAIRKIVWSAAGDDVIDWTTLDAGPCGCLPDGTIVFHKLGTRTLSYYVLDEFGHAGPIRQRLIRNKAPLVFSSLTATPETFSTILSGGANQSTITYGLSESGTVTVRIFNGSGSVVRTLVNGASRSAGLYSSGDVWDGRDSSGVLLPSCRCRVQLDGFDSTGNAAASASTSVVIDATLSTSTVPVASGVGVTNPAATPELDSLVLFGGGMGALAGYGLLRIRIWRRPTSAQNRK